jgi:hypothetical protein
MAKYVSARSPHSTPHSSRVVKREGDKGVGLRTSTPSMFYLMSGSSCAVCSYRVTIDSRRLVVVLRKVMDNGQGTLQQVSNVSDISKRK